MIQRSKVTPHAQATGLGGQDVDIRYNSFFFINGPAIKIRGTPQVQDVIRSHVFGHLFLGDAVQLLDGVGCVFLGDDNQVGGRPSWTTSCDFDGDGINDTFMTTGQTWWYLSGGSYPWVYLNASTLTLDRGEVTLLGDVDGDRLCDVVAGDVLYSDGMPQRLAPRPIPTKARLLSQ